MADKLFIDTNILVYLANESSEFHHRTLIKFQHLAASHHLFVSRQIIREYAVIMTRPGILEFPLTPDEVVEDIEQWKSSFEIVNETEDVTDKLMFLIKKYDLKGKRIHDANIVATMLVHRISLVFTANEGDFKKFDEIDIVTI